VSALARSEAFEHGADPATDSATDPAAEPTAGSATGDRVAEALEILPAIDLPTLEAGAPLLTRVDRKYIVKIATFERLVAALGEHDDWRALAIDGSRMFGYQSTYFDTPDLTTYRAHLQRRRHRCKVRVRWYVDSGDCMLEVKRKGVRGLTIKERQRHDRDHRDDLGLVGRAFVQRAAPDDGRLDVAALRPVLVTDNRRATLASLSGHARVTVDTDLVCGWGDRQAALLPDYVVLESKGQGRATVVDRLLHTHGERPQEISKYCVGVASLGLNVPNNPRRRTLRTFFDSAADPVDLPVPVPSV
jgi:hypothetical protein